ncbi:hypothetical protein EWB00_009557 [Schistosoma japonicum]|uniref:Uncharacterized protein n=1 Tax=Schistosoma japonicum TaxID=6182 RepID=A0A4Z2CLW7_SCHJA|nr:hypothetical protein EWB00_009557 [Schistosoma japonicum]
MIINIAALTGENVTKICGHCQQFNVNNATNPSINDSSIIMHTKHEPNEHNQAGLYVVHGDGLQ